MRVSGECGRHLGMGWGAGSGRMLVVPFIYVAVVSLAFLWHSINGTRCDCETPNHLWLLYNIHIHVLP